MKNMKVSMKLTVSFAILIILMIIVGVFGIAGMNALNDAQNDMYDYHVHAVEAMGDLRELFANERNTMRTIIIHQNDPARVQSELDKFAEYDKMAAESFALYDKTITDEATEQDYLIGKKTWLTDYADLKEQCFALIREGRFDEAYETYTSIGAPIIGPISDGFKKSAEINNQWALEANEEGRDIYLGNTRMLVIAMVVAILVAIFFIYYISSLIAKPLRNLVNAADNIAAGNLNINIDRSAKDETGDLATAFNQVIITINSVISDLSELARQFTVLGDIDYRIDSEKYKGAYNEMIKGINGLVKSSVDDTLLVISNLAEVSNGNFDLSIPKLPGKKIVINQNFEAVSSSLNGLYNDMTKLVNSAAEGNLTARADAVKYNGGWKRIIEAINHLVEEIEGPVNETVEILGNVSRGNFDEFAKGDYRGDFLKIKNSINDTVTNVASYIDEISRVLAALADNDLDQEITRDYVGKFSEIKEAINNIITKFNRVITDIFSAADQVAAGSKQISESSMTLAQGATEQASAIQELNATITTINENTISNAESAKEAEQLSNDSKIGAASGTENMTHMLSSMEGIKDSSNKISKIIKVIDDIAFQTNLLALNAAVEAARAGEHGKGFAVVAEEVRNLAGRSQQAAKETAELIEESIMKVNEGTKIADQTSDALQSIVTGVEKVAAIITDIAVSSGEQTDAISQVVQGVQQITEVVQNNSATSEESASASEELASQADVLKSLVDVFKTKEM